MIPERLYDLFPKDDGRLMVMLGNVLGVTLKPDFKPDAGRWPMYGNLMICRMLIRCT